MVPFAGHANVHHLATYSFTNGLLWKENDLRWHSNSSPHHDTVYHAFILFQGYKNVRFEIFSYFSIYEEFDFRWSDDFYNSFYYLTHTRTTPWLIGLIFGDFILDFQANKERYQIKSKVRILLNKSQ